LKVFSLLELTCPFDSHAELSTAHECKQMKPEYLQIVSELSHLGFVSQYYTIAIGCLGHYFKETVTSMKQISNQKVFPSQRQQLIEQLLWLLPLPRESSLLGAILLGLFNFCLIVCFLAMPTWIMIFVVPCIQGIVVIIDIASHSLKKQKKTSK